MDFDLKDIKNMRKRFGLTQFQLAKKADVSQSLIAKVEAGRLDPTYTNAQKIFSALRSLTERQDEKVEKIMTKKMISVTPDSDIEEVVKKMKKHEISQLPVIEKDKAVGQISETIILEALMSGKKHLKAKDVMIDAPPVIGKDASVTVASGLLKYYPIILVAEKGKILGLLTKADIIGSFSKF